MFDVADHILACIRREESIAVATVIGVDGSAPRALGTSMAVDAEGQIIGSLSGGCVEAAVYDACQTVLASGAAQIEEFGFTDEDDLAVGLACGGRITVFVQEFSGDPERATTDAEVVAQLELAVTGRPAGLAVIVDPLRRRGALIAPGAARPSDPGRSDGAPWMPLDRRLQEVLEAGITAGSSGFRVLECDGESLELTVLVAAAPPRMIIFGAVDFASALSHAAVLLGYRVTVCDARSLFATQARFPGAEVVVSWPSHYLADTDIDERTVVCVLTHDDKFDIPVLELALALPVAFVGAMGSRMTHQRRREKLLSRGVTERQLASLHSPIGLDLGARTPEETAVSILAEVLVARSRASAQPLSQRTGPIHARPVHAE